MTDVTSFQIFFSRCFATKLYTTLVLLNAGKPENQGLGSEHVHQSNATSQPCLLDPEGAATCSTDLICLVPKLITLPSTETVGGSSDCNEIILSRFR